MKEEELDWRVYHLLIADEKRSCQDLAAAAGCTTDDLERSLHRLETAMLIECREGAVRVLSMQETILLSQSRYDRSCPFELVGGVIRAKHTGDDLDRH